MAKKIVKYNIRRNHKILTKYEWETYLKVVPRESANAAFSSRILLTPSRDSIAILNNTTHDTINKLENEIKEIIFKIDSRMRGVVYISIPPSETTYHIQRETDKFKAVRVCVFFSEESDADLFYKKCIDGISFVLE